MRKRKRQKSAHGRPNFLRALGKSEPPSEIDVEGQLFRLSTIYKHDSWAATAVYQRCDDRGPERNVLRVGPNEVADGPEKNPGKMPRQIVCKFNRCSSILGIPTAWIGRWLARREAMFLRELSDVSGIPQGYERIVLNGQLLKNAVAHEFIEGTPLSLVTKIEPKYFEQLELLLQQMHRRRMAYVDLHKAENVLVSSVGSPYLIDFQISVRAPRIPGFNWFIDWVMRMLQQSDRYHLLKHRTWRLDRVNNDRVMRANRPWWIRLHRAVGVPFRTIRRTLLVLIGVRRAGGMAATEKCVEPGLSRSGY